MQVTNDELPDRSRVKVTEHPTFCSKSELEALNHKYCLS